MRATRLRRLGRLEGRARAESQVGGMVRVPDEVGFPPPHVLVRAGNARPDAEIADLLRRDTG